MRPNEVLAHDQLDDRELLVPLGHRSEGRLEEEGEFEDVEGSTAEAPLSATERTQEELLLEQLAERDLLGQLASALPALFGHLPPKVGERAMRAFRRAHDNHRDGLVNVQALHHESGVWARAEDAHSTTIWNDERMAFRVLELLHPCVEAVETRRSIDNVADELEQLLWRKVVALVSARNARLIALSS
ncbi:MAG: hypothetical protein IT290_03380 [Deltaproteobacteria bacterium]|nr:hypothetical protein [Deltaproteobacteria bacterium]